MEKKFRIGVLARRTGISTSAIDFYVRNKLLAVEGRTPKNHRLFSEKAVERIMLIRDLRNGGRLKIRGIQDIFSPKQ